MSSDYSVIVLLRSIQTNLYKFGGPILMGFGTVSCLMSTIVFLKKNLRGNPCSIYLVACNMVNLLIICASILSATLANGYSIYPSGYNLLLCRLGFYALLLFDILSPSYLILASIDRIFLTSRNARTRQRSTPRLAYISILIITILWSLFHIHALVLTTITEPIQGVFICYFRSGTHIVLMGYYSVIFKGIFIPLLMMISGLWAVNNVRKLAYVTPLANSADTVTIVIRSVRTAHSKDRQLLRILLADITVYIIFSSMIVIVLMYQQFIQYQLKTLVEGQTLNFLLNVGLFSGYIPFCTGGYTNLLVSKTFRQEVKNILMCK